MSVKPHSIQVTARFLQAMKQIIARDLAASQKEFAEKVGEYTQNISKMESGDRYPTIDVMCNTCIAYGIDSRWLLLGKGEMFTNYTSPDLSERVANIERLLKISSGNGDKIRNKRRHSDV